MAESERDGVHHDPDQQTDQDASELTANFSQTALALFAAGNEDEARRTDNLQAALTTRGLIGQAQGILMERERITADQAFDVLRRASQRLNIKLRDVAQTLIDTGEDPAGRRPDT